MTEFEDLVHRILEDEWEAPFPEERSIKHAATLLEAARKQIEEEPISEKVGEAILRASRRVMMERANSKYPYFNEGDFSLGFEIGAHWRKKQIMKNAIEVTVEMDDGGYPYIHKTIELYDYYKDEPLAKAGDKVKVILIKDE